MNLDSNMHGLLIEESLTIVNDILLYDLIFNDGLANMGRIFNSSGSPGTVHDQRTNVSERQAAAASALCFETTI